MTKHHPDPVTGCAITRLTDLAWYVARPEAEGQQVIT
jgi:hypothetical protein